MFLELNSKGLYQSSGKEKESCCLRFPSLTKPEIKHFHVVVVQWRQRNVQKSVMHVQNCCFANLNLLLFCRSDCYSRRRWLSSISTDNNNKGLFNCNCNGSKRTNDITSLHSQEHHGLTDERPITSRLYWPIRSITRVKYHQLTWYNSLWLWRWLQHSHCQQQSWSGLLMKWLLDSIFHSYNESVILQRW